MRKLALDAVGAHSEYADLVEDWVQDVLTDLVAEGYGGGAWPAMAEIAARLARRVARGKQDARRRRARKRDAARNHGRQPGRTRRTGRSTPPLCPGLAGLARFHPESIRLLETLLAAARWVAHEPKVLKHRQLRAFVLAYEDQRPLTKLQAMLKAPTPRATVERLRRTSECIERALVRRVGLVLSPNDRRRLAARLKSSKAVPAENKRKTVATPFLAGLSEKFEEALRSLFEP